MDKIEEIRRRARRAEDISLERAEAPRTPPETRGGDAVDKNPANAESALKRPSAALACERKNYGGMYAAARAYHGRHNPPGLEDADYWRRATDEMGIVARGFGNDPFLVGLLMAVYGELEREYARLKDVDTSSK